MELYKEWIGNPDSDTLIIFLHEGLGCTRMWKDFPAVLCEQLNYQGLVYDRAGYGQSPGNLNNRTIRYLHEGADELNLLIEEIDSNQRIILYGHSDGGSIALIFPSIYPNKVSAIITEAAHVFVEDETVQGVQKALDLYNQGKFDGLEKYHGDRWREVFHAWNDIWQTDAFREWNIVFNLSRIQCPVLALQGDQDEYGTEAQTEAILEEVIGTCICANIPEAGHSPHKEVPLQVIEVIKNFIDEEL